MDVEIREAEEKDLGKVGDLFAAHLAEQFSMDPFASPNNAFDPHWFIRAMMNPPVNHILLARHGGEIIGFARLAVLYGEGLIPVAPVKVRRAEKSYLKKVPVAALKKLRDLVDTLIARIEKRRTISQIALPTRRGYVADFYVLPEHRRKGVGVKLFDASKSWFLSRGLYMLDLQYLAANEAGRAFWEAMGFKPYRFFAKALFAPEKNE